MSATSTDWESAYSAFENSSMNCLQFIERELYKYCYGPLPKVKTVYNRFAEIRRQRLIQGSPCQAEVSDSVINIIWDQPVSVRYLSEEQLKRFLPVSSGVKNQIVIQLPNGITVKTYVNCLETAINRLLEIKP